MIKIELAKEVINRKQIIYQQSERFIGVKVYNQPINIRRIAVLYRDLLSHTIHSLSDDDKKLLLSIQPKNKIVAIGDIDYANWNT